ncbi:hypothetical protein ACVIVD_007111 [Bradyrhizobium liaoningense]
MPVLMSVLMHGTSVPRVVKSTRESRSSRPPKRGGVVVPLSFDVHPNQITIWKNQLLEGAAGVFGHDKTSAETPVDLKALHAKIGELALENDFLSGALTKGLLSAKR